MSETSSGPAQPNTGDGTKTPSRDISDFDTNPDAIATVETELVKSGVKPELAAAVARVVMTQVASYHSGPLPSVTDFAGYEQICPGAAKDILAMAQQQQAHLQAMQRAEVYGDIALRALGMLSALFVVSVMLASALYAAINGHDGLAIAIASGTGFSLVAAVFVRNFATTNTEPPTSTSKSRAHL